MILESNAQPVIRVQGAGAVGGAGVEWDLGRGLGVGRTSRSPPRPLHSTKPSPQNPRRIAPARCTLITTPRARHGPEPIVIRVQSAEAAGSAGVEWDLGRVGGGAHFAFPTTPAPFNKTLAALPLRAAPCTLITI